jgi:hypothetical protein
MYREKHIRRKRLWRRVRKIAVITVLVLMLLVLLAPSLVPSAVISGAIARSLAQSTGRPVHVGHCSLGWLSGVTIDELWIGADDGAAGRRSVHLEGIRLEFMPWELPSVVFSEEPRLGRATIGRLVLRVARKADGTLDWLESTGRPPDFKSIKVTDGEVHLADQAGGRPMRVKMLQVSAGRIEGTDKVYVTAGGRLLYSDEEGAAGTAVLRVNGLIDHLDLDHLEKTTGGCDIGWDGVDLAYFIPALRPSPGELPAVRATIAGQASFRVDASDMITVRGNVASPQIVAGGDAADPDIAINRLILSFSGAYNKASGDLMLEPAQLSGAGSSLRMTGRATRGAEGRMTGELTLSGTLNWAPLKREIALLGRALRQFPEATMTGSADIREIRITLGPEKILYRGSVDLRRTEFLWRPYIVKPADVRATLELDGALALRSGRLSLGRTALAINPPPESATGDAGQADLVIAARSIGSGEGDAPNASDSGGDPDDLKVTMAVADMDRLSQYVPLAAAWVRRFSVAGSLGLSAMVRPRADGLSATLRIDATGTQFETAPGIGKTAGTPMSLEVVGRLGADGGTPEVRRAKIDLEDSTLLWSGSVRPQVTEDDLLRLVFQGRAEILGIQRWLHLARPHLPSQPSVGMVGHVICEDVQGSLDDRTLWVKVGMFDATRASLEINHRPGRVRAEDRLLTKPIGKAATGHMTVTQDRLDDKFVLTMHMDIVGAALDVVASARIPDDAAEGDNPVGLATGELDLTFAAHDIRPMLGDMPILSARLQPYDPGGGLALKLDCVLGEKFTVRGLIDLTDTTYRAPNAETGVTKTAGWVQRLSFELAAPRNPVSQSARFDVKRLNLQVGKTALAVVGHVVVDSDTLRRVDSAAAAMRTVRSMDLDANVVLSQSDDLKRFSRWWQRFSTRHEVEGQARVHVALSGNRDQGQFGLTIDGTRAGFTYGEGTHKPIGTPAKVEMAVRTAPVAQQLDLQKMSLRIADTEAECSGTLYCRRWALLGDEPVDFVLHLEGKSVQLARLAQLVPLAALRRLEPQGGVAFSLDVARDRYGVELESGEFTFRRARVQYGGVPIDLDGRLSIGRKRFAADALAVSVADSSVVLAADIANPFDAPEGEFSLTGTRLDFDRMLAIFAPEQGKQAEAPPVGIPPEWPGASAFLSRMNVTGRMAIDKFAWTDETGCRYDWDALATDLSIRAGRFDVPSFKAVMLGGVVAGRVSIDLAEAAPSMAVAYSARGLGGGEKLGPIIAKLFPNMSIAGKADQVYEARVPLFATEDRPKVPVGISRFAATKGEMVGPAAPEWLTGLLPGLKLARYEFTRMESITDLKASGRAESFMFFEGPGVYSVYIEGYTELDGKASYTLGVDLFNSLDRDEEFRKLEQGLVPLLVYEGRIVDSKWAEQTVRFKTPAQVAHEVLFKRSLLVKLLEKGGEKRRPDFDPYKIDPKGPDEK